MVRNFIYIKVPFFLVELRVHDCFTVYWFGYLLQRTFVYCCIYIFNRKNLGICPDGTILHPVDGFSWNLVVGNFLKIIQENSSFIKIWQEQQVLYVKTPVYFDSMLLNSSENEKVKGKTCTENQNTIYVQYIFLKIVPFMR